jgi:putative ABC transport system permease protein
MNDFRFAIRQLFKHPSFTIIAGVTLALGIGASTAIFSVLDAVLLRPMPYPNQEQLVEVRELDEAGRGMAFAQPNFNDLLARSHSFDDIAYYAPWPEAVAGGSEPIRTNACRVSADFFRALGVRPIIGRLISAEETKDEKQLAVVSYGFWKRLLAGRSNLDGTALRFGNRSFTVIGVLPPQTEFPPGVDVWYPAEIYPPFESRTAHNFGVVGRLHAGVSFAQAQTEIAAIGRSMKAKHGSQTDAASFGLLPLRERFVRDVRNVLFVLCGAGGVLLAVACANVANLLLVRASVRRKEVALRAALGASRARLARQFIAETLVLTFAAGAVGALLAAWSVGLITRLYHGDLPRVGEIGVSTNVLLFTFTISTLIAVILGLVPVFQSSRGQLQDDLHAAGHGASTGRAQMRTRNVLIIAQMALTLMLLIGAGLLGKSFQRLLEVNAGFWPENVVAMTVSMPQAEEPAALRALAQFYRQLLERMQSLPGTSASGGINALPMSGRGAHGTFLEQRCGKSADTMKQLITQFDALSPSERARDADYRAASAGYFSAMGIPLVRGRFFQDSDGPGAPHVALVSQSLAKRYWPDEEAIGKQIQFGNMDGDLHLLNIIGVVGDVRDNGLDREVRPTVYVNYFQRPASTAEFSLVLRGRGNSAGLIAAMRREARSLNPEMPTKFEMVDQIVSASLNNRRFSMIMLGIFGGTAMTLALVGVYGMMSYVAAQRTNEIGIRMALGAQARHILEMILRQGAALVLAGVAIGLVIAFLLTRLMAHLLYGISATDPFTFAMIAFLLTAIALLACYFPARRAARVDPVIALRAE